MQTVTPRMVSLDVVGLPELRPEEAAAPAAVAGRRARVLALADHHQRDDADEPGPGEELGDPLVEAEVADQRQREVRP